MIVGIQSHDRIFILVAAVIIIVISIFRLILEIIQVLKSIITPYYQRYEYFLDLANWLEVPLYTCVIIFAASQFSSECTCVDNWEWNVGTIGLFLAWASLVVYLRKFELLGKLSSKVLC